MAGGSLATTLSKQDRDELEVAERLSARCSYLHVCAECKMRPRVGPGLNSRDLVFPGPDGEPWWSSNFARACRRVFERAGIECRIHDLRHTHATMFLRQGLHPKVVQERLGHASIGITLDTTVT